MGRPENFRWTMPGMATYQSEGIIYAKHILQTKPDAKIAILSQNDDFGRDYVAGFKRGLGDKAATMIISEASYETSAPTISSQLATLKASGANVMFGVVLGKFTSQMIKGVAEINWKPDLFFVPTSASSISFLEPAGLDNAVGLISSSNQKDTLDAQWANDAGVKEYFAFMKQYLPNADLTNSNYAAGYHYATLMAKVLTACKDDLSRDNIMKQAASLREVPLPLLLPGITVSTGADDYLPFQQLRLRRFDGKSWVGFDEIWTTARISQGLPRVTEERKHDSIISGERQISYPDIHARIARAAAGFKAIGLGGGTPVGMMLRNDFAFFEVSGGAAALGSPVVPINWHLKAEEVAYILADSGAKILVCHADLLPQIRDGLPGDMRLLVVTTPPEIAARSM